MHDHQTITLKQEIDARDQYARDKALLYDWRRRIAGDKTALDVKLRLENDFAAFREYSAGPDAAA
jgi:hypothetical protein